MKMVAESKRFMCFEISMQVIGAVSKPALKHYRESRSQPLIGSVLRNLKRSRVNDCASFLLGGPPGRSAYFSILRLGPQRCMVGS